MWGTIPEQRPKDFEDQPTAPVNYPNLAAFTRRVVRDAIGLGVILACQMAGIVLQRMAGGPVPASIYGMAILLLLLAADILPQEPVQAAASDLLLILPALFVPLFVAPLSDPHFWANGGLVALIAAGVVAPFVMIVIGRLAAWMVRS